MNERIQELMLEAGKTIPGDKHIDADFCKKFAELIVRECSEFARQHNLEKADRSHMIHKAIKEHFGVKE
jgi:predicted house-cleaning noncanonical NTP pyrophosphatase (MazG superfamily)